jgi:hypothetical protein
MKRNEVGSDKFKVNPPGTKFHGNSFDILIVVNYTIWSVFSELNLRSNRLINLPWSYTCLYWRYSKDSRLINNINKSILWEGFYWLRLKRLSQRTRWVVVSVLLIPLPKYGAVNTYGECRTSSTLNLGFRSRWVVGYILQSLHPLGSNAHLSLDRIQEDSNGGQRSMLLLGLVHGLPNPQQANLLPISCSWKLQICESWEISRFILFMPILAKSIA